MNSVDHYASPSARTLLFAGGGTGGHLFPGVAVADAWKTEFPQDQILFVGSLRSIEQQILQQAGYSAQGLPFQSPAVAWKQPWKFWRQWRSAMKQARQILAEQSPALTVGLGGFASYPILRQAARQQVPLILLEQNVVPGKVTSLFAARANRVCCSYEETARYLSRRATVAVTGNPLRTAVTELCGQEPAPGTPPVLLVCGGSQGSNCINQLLLSTLQTSPEILKGWKVRHQTGKLPPADNLQTFRKAYQQAEIDAEVAEFFPSPADMYRDVRLAVSRAGGTTLAELAALEIAVLVIPMEKSARNHQHSNAVQHLRQHPGVLLTEPELKQENRFPSAFRQLSERLLSQQQRANPPAEHTALRPEQATWRVVAEMKACLKIM